MLRVKQLHLALETQSTLSRQQLRIGETGEITGRSKITMEHSATFVVEHAATLTVKSHSGDVFYLRVFTIVFFDQMNYIDMTEPPVPNTGKSLG